MTSTLRARAMKAVRDHAPELDGADLRDLGSGLDHGTFLVGDLVVRVSRSAEPSTERELLALVARHVSIPVPAPRFADPEHGVLAYPLLPGRPLLGRTAPPGAATRLGHFLRELHGIDPVEVGHLVPTEVADPDEWLAELDGPAPPLDVLRADRPGATTQLVLAHADLGAEHILAYENRLTGVIDWSDAALTDPALDLARPYRDFGPAFLHATLAAYGSDSPDLRQRTRFFARCAALEDLAYGHASGRSEYSRSAERSLTWLFPSR
jgi:aminoglycoside phosphotransferase (APT) family kinase protein